MVNQNYRGFYAKELSATFELQLTWSSISIQTHVCCNTISGTKMRVKFCIFGKVNFIGIKTSRQLTCLYIGSLIFSVYVLPKISKKNFTTHTLAKF